MILEPRTVPTQIEFQDLNITLPELQVYFQGREIHLSLTQLRLLLVFLSDPYGRFTTSELMRRVQLPSKQALAVLVASLRTRLDQKYIVTVPGVGYAFMVEK